IRYRSAWRDYKNSRVVKNGRNTHLHPLSPVGESRRINHDRLDQRVKETSCKPNSLKPDLFFNPMANSRRLVGRVNPSSTAISKPPISTPSNPFNASASNVGTTTPSSRPNVSFLPPSLISATRVIFSSTPWISKPATCTKKESSYHLERGSPCRAIRIAATVTTKTPASNWTLA